MDIHEDESVKSEAQELKKLSEEEHEKVIELSEKAQTAHEEMLKYFRKTDDIRTAADEAHKKFIEARKNASAKHEEFKAILSINLDVENLKIKVLLAVTKTVKKKKELKKSLKNSNKVEKSLLKRFYSYKNTT